MAHFTACAGDAGTMRHFFPGSLCRSRNVLGLWPSGICPRRAAGHRRLGRSCSGHRAPYAPTPRIAAGSVKDNIPERPQAMAEIAERYDRMVEMAENPRVLNGNER